MLKINDAELEWNLAYAQKKVDDPVKKVIQIALESSCSLFVRTPEGEWTGSGFHLGKGMVATASHVVPPHTPLEITASFDGSEQFPCNLIVSEPDFDSAILYCPFAEQKVPSVTLSDSNTVEIGDIVACISSPEGWHNTATVGRVTNIHQSLPGNDPDLEAWKDIIFIDADILQGSSGGMALTTDAKVIGSVMGVTGDNAEIGIGERAICPSNKINKLLQAALSVQ